MIRDLEGQNVVITGANIGIGLATARALAARGASLTLLCRSREKTLPVCQELGASFVACDLGKLDSVRAAASEVLASGKHIHILVNNAGVAGQRGQTADGFELAWGTNHLGHYLLTELLLPRIIESAPARIVIVASASHYAAKKIDWEACRRPTASYTGLPEYARSKAANVIHGRELAARLAGKGVITASLNPGRIASNIWTRMPPPFRQIFKATMWSTERGAQSSVHCATAPDLESGGFYDKYSRLRPPSKLVLDAAFAAELIRQTRQSLGLPA